jgi:hypothetical protein
MSPIFVAGTGRSGTSRIADIIGGVIPAMGYA